MVTCYMKQSFLEVAKLSPGGYGRNNQEIIALDRLVSPVDIARFMRDSNTSAVTIMDESPDIADSIVQELASISEEILNRFLYLHFKDAHDFEVSFQRRFYEALRNARVLEPIPDFPLLQQRLAANLAKAANIFDLNAPLPMTLYHSYTTSFQWHDHEDLNIRAISCFAEEGTVIAPDDSVLVKGPDDFEVTGNLYHTGAGLTFIKGRVVHSPYPVKSAQDARPICAIDGRVLD
jgi:hypothetical protein